MIKMGTIPTGTIPTAMDRNTTKDKAIATNMAWNNMMDRARMTDASKMVIMIPTVAPETTTVSNA